MAEGLHEIKIKKIIGNYTYIDRINKNEKSGFFRSRRYVEY